MALPQHQIHRETGGGLQLPVMDDAERESRESHRPADNALASDPVEHYYETFRHYKKA